MKFAGPCPADVWRSVAAAALLLLPAGSVWSQDANPTASATADTPYAPIVARNMFALLPIPPPDPDADKPPVDPPPKITPTGIMTIFGRDQALFRVSNKPKPGQQAKDDAYVLAEGERQDDIEVVKINHADGIITFNNHGAVQELPLIVAKDAGGPAPGPGGGPAAAPAPGLSRPGLPALRPGVGGFQSRAFGGAGAALGNSPGNPGLGGGFNNSAATASTSGGLNVGGSQVNERGIYQPPADDLTPEQSVILMEAQRDAYLQQGNERMANLLPPTPITQQLMQQRNGGTPPAP